MLDRLKRVSSFMDYLIFGRKACIANFIPLVPFLHVKKFVVGGGGGCSKWILVLSFRPKLNNNKGDKLVRDYHADR